MSSWPCPVSTCSKICRSPGGLTQHLNCRHRHDKNFGKREKVIQHTCHPILDGKWDLLSIVYLPNCRNTGTPCDADGYDLESDVAPSDHPSNSQGDWSPFTSQSQFETADFLFKKAEMSHADIDTLMRLWASTTSDGCAPFLNHQELLTKIDAIDVRDVPWQSFSAKYSGTPPPTDPPDWMLKEYTIYFRDPLAVVRNMISNPGFKHQFDYTPYREFEDGVRRWTDLMSGDWAWDHAVCLPSISMTRTAHHAPRTLSAKTSTLTVQ